MKSYHLPHWIYSLPVIVSALLMMQQTIAQEIKKEVFVVKPYEPTLTDASKISYMPSVEDMEVTTPSFTYKIYPTPIETQFEVTPIRPAKLVSSALPKIYNSFIKIGLGNYITPMAEFNISNLYSKEYAIGAYLYHKSSYSNIVLENKDKVPGGYSVSNVNVYGKKFFNDFTLTGNILFDHDGFHYYGYNTRLFDSIAIPDIDRDDIHQRTILIGGQVGAHSNFIDSSRLNYKLNLRYNYFTDKSGNTENMILIKAAFSKMIQGFMADLGLTVNYFKPSLAMDSVGNVQISFSPSISKRSKDWKFLIGLDGIINHKDISSFYLYPKGLLEFTVIEKIMIPFIGVSGKLETNHYQKIMLENHFIEPGLKAENTSHRFTAFAGLKGSITPHIIFRADVSYSSVRDMYFFVNDTSPASPLQNTFYIDYDDIDLIQYHGELSVEPSATWNCNAGFTYYSYNMREEKKPWHKPLYDLTLNASYLLKEKIILSGGLLLTGKRYAKTSVAVNPAGYTTLDAFVDINLGIKYMYSKLFTVFLDINNISDGSYMLWNQYPSQRFNMMIGFTYKL